LLTFDVAAESVQVRTTPDLPTALSKGQFARTGVDRILALLDKFAIHATFFTPAWTAQQYPDLVREIVRRGHELAAHGVLHENLSELKDGEEEAVHATSVRILEELGGKRPVGFRAPYYEWSTRTAAFLKKYGFLYDSSLMDRDRPYRIRDGPGAGMYELPVEWFLEDWVFFEEQRQPPSAVLETWRSEFDAVSELGVGYFILTMHPECIGRASRIRMLEQLVDHIRATPGVAFARCDELVEYLSGSQDSHPGTD